VTDTHVTLSAVFPEEKLEVPALVVLINHVTRTGKNLAQRRHREIRAIGGPIVCSAGSPDLALGRKQFGEGKCPCDLRGILGRSGRQQERVRFISSDEEHQMSRRRYGNGVTSQEREGNQGCRRG
jgi:hypothetical protein